MAVNVEEITEFHAEKLAADCLREINKQINGMKCLNIMVLGKSGVGKSTLINSVFRENLADTGIGRPVTQEIRCYTKQGLPLKIYDTPGFELGKNQLDEVLQLIKDKANSTDVNNAIHCIWYCINVGSNRIEPVEIERIKAFTEENKVTNIPVFILLTQSYPKKKAQELQKQVEAENLNVCKVIPVLAQDIELDDDYIIKSYGLDTLIELMAEQLPQELQNTLQNVQIASLELKKKRAQAVVTAAVAAAFGEGFMPVPFADAAMIIPTQITMLASITAVFGISVDQALLTCIVSSTVGAGSATIIGRTIVSNLLKFIPVVGQAAGSAISGTTAALLTTALGEAYIKIMELMFKGKMKKEDLTTQAGQQMMKEIFEDTLRNHNSQKD